MKAADRLILLESSSEQVSACEIIENKTPAEAMQEAKKRGCIGIHKMGELWMPCATHGATQ